MNVKSLNVTSPSQLKLVKYFLKTSSEKLYLRLEKLTMMDFFYLIMLAKEMVIQHIGGSTLDKIKTEYFTPYFDHKKAILPLILTSKKKR